MTLGGVIVGSALGQVSTLLGATLISSAWDQDRPRRSAVGIGIGLVVLGAALSVASAQGGRR